MIPNSFDRERLQLSGLLSLFVRITKLRQNLSSSQLFTELLFFKMMEPVGQCVFRLSAQNKRDKMAQSCPIGIFPIVYDVMNSSLQRKLRVAEPQATTTFSLYANDHRFLQWSISIPVVCFCLFSQMDMPTPHYTKIKNNYSQTLGA